MEEWWIEIEKVSNWYMLIESSWEGESINVFWYDDDIYDEDKMEQECLQRVFYHIQDYFAVFNSKHNKTRLDIEINNQED